MRPPLGIFRVANRSMEPTLHDGDYVLVNNWFNVNGVKAGDVVVLRHPKKDFYIIKRVSGTSGNYCEVRGDNMPVSQDSRDFGRVNKNSIIGKFIMRL